MYRKLELAIKFECDTFIGFQLGFKLTNYKTTSPFMNAQIK